MMLSDVQLSPADPRRESLRRYHLADEDQAIDELLPLADLGECCGRAHTYARVLVAAIRQQTAGKGGVDALLNEYALSTDEGVALMCLAEALLRVPDPLTADRLIRDKLQHGDWENHLGNNPAWLVNAATRGLILTAKLQAWSDRELRHKTGVLKRLLGTAAQPVIRAAVRRAMGIMGDTFVMGRTIDNALTRARRQEARGYTYSYDMLGEGARTAADAERYFHSYRRAIERIGVASAGRGPLGGPGISVKLSALHPRYHAAHRHRVMEELVPRLQSLALLAKQYNIGLTVDAEEAARLELSLDVIETVFTHADLAGWEGFGLAVQAYQKRALFVIEWANHLARHTGRRMCVRLVKGAYWDTEIKLAQMEGLSDYPVFTRKASTDVSYLACARTLLAYRAHLYPQFATHNAYSVAAILAMDDDQSGFEFQRLHGMGEALYNQVLTDTGIPCRIYAPVGEHADLLAYLVRRLLENGANSSFVNNIVDNRVPAEELIADPVNTVRGWSGSRNPAIPLPKNLYGADRTNAAGVSLSDPLPLRAMQKGMQAAWTATQTKRTSDSEWPARETSVLAISPTVEGTGSQHTTQPPQTPIHNPAATHERVGTLAYDDKASMEHKLAAAHQAFAGWSQSMPWYRARLLNRFADALEAHRDQLMMLCVKEAGKNIADSLADLREAVDFCRYYAQQATHIADTHGGEPRGVVLCISPWNFPLAIFVGQVTAALAAGNTVIAKPAEQTSLIARRTVELFYQCGLPANTLQLVISPGKPAGETLVPDPRIQAVTFTGSTDTGRWLFQTLAQRDDAPIPLIAETGGQNAMIVDATALPEQVVDDVIRSGFQSAGQRCSALRVLFLQQEIADRTIDMIRGAMAELSIGDPALLSTDVGPVIDDNALARLQAHTERLQHRGRLLYQCALPLTAKQGRFFAPALYEIDNLAELNSEVFGPVVHVVRYRANDIDGVIGQINDAGYGLTLGIHSRVQRTADHIAANAKVGNIYINRDMIGAVVGVQPFGGRGLSGTGPKAGGPGYLRRLVRPHDAITHNENTAHPLDGLLHPLIRHAAETGFSNNPDRLTPTPCRQTFQHIRQAVARAMPLPGPTGEANTLHYEPRGHLAALYRQTDDPVHCLATLVAALGCGNRLSLYVPSAWLEWCQRLIEALIPHQPGKETITVTETPPSSRLDELLAEPHLTGIIIPPHSAIRTDIVRGLANRPGSLPAIICEPPGAFYLHRFLVEKTITNNTTAAGGNASLMTLVDGQETKAQRQA